MTTVSSDAKESKVESKWVIAEIMGHRVVAGRLAFGDPPYGSGVAIDVPLPDGGFLQEYYGSAAIFALRIVPEAVARKQGISWHVQEITRALLPAHSATPEDVPVRSEEIERVYRDIDEKLGVDTDYDMQHPDEWEADIGNALKDAKSARRWGAGHRNALLVVATCAAAAIRDLDMGDDLGLGKDEDDLDLAQAACGLCDTVGDHADSCPGIGRHTERQEDPRAEGPGLETGRED